MIFMFYEHTRQVSAAVCRFNVNRPTIQIKSNIEQLFLQSIENL